ncbi:hypothetical protein FNYG_08609 [Fusarium nygamai]|uniref:Calpain catalytic domain-containing protein n=1 Tax=Gibberella nygamai TaxID=42673 RepID=A0A2K0W6H6_GIBNY|nr:hypothetical protein FNYG_08609 [Fusarium nygamai]
MSISSQEILSKFWFNYCGRKSENVLSIFPPELHEYLLADIAVPCRLPSATYDAAAQQCRDDVQAIVRECMRTNNKFSDPEFDIDRDFSSNDDNCLFGIIRDDVDLGDRPGSVHRIPWIFENPQFVSNGFNSDIKQGNSKNCWWLAGLAAVSRRKDLLERICVARDENCGVYGFVFYRDGEWISTVVDDNLYLCEKDFSSDIYDTTGRMSLTYRKHKQTGSDALFFAKCGGTDETWLPLLEKAFAKVHGDYAALDSGWAGTAVEDLTGGVTTVIRGDMLLCKERLWCELLAIGEGNLLFSLSTGSQGDSYRNGLALRHDYTVLDAIQVEDELGDTVSLVKIRNPWGQRCPSGYGDWVGAWSDGSESWTPFMMKKLQHKFGDDGTFWMSFQDMLDNFHCIYKTRLFDRQWMITQQWINVSVPWLGDYLKRRFILKLPQDGMVVLVLSQLDDRYFQDLKGEYEFTIHFALRLLGNRTPICQVQPVHHLDTRSVNCELTLEAGTYEIIPKIVAERDELYMPVEKMVCLAAYTNPAKLRQAGRSYDLAHAKAGEIDGGNLVTTVAGKDPTSMQVLPTRLKKDLSGSYPKIMIHDTESKPDSESGSDTESDSDTATDTTTDCDTKHTWSPSCVIGLRVLARFGGIEIRVTDDQ